MEDEIAVEGPQEVHHITVAVLMDIQSMLAEEEQQTFAP